MSPRDIRSRFSCFVGGSGTLGGGVGGGPNCGFSTYYNGTIDVTEPFVYRAPLRLVDGDSVVNTTKSVDWKATGFDLRLVANVVFSEQDTNDRYARHESTLSSGAIVAMSYINGTQEVRFFASDSANNFYGTSIDVAGLSFETLRFVYDTTNLFMYIDDVQVGTAVWAVGGGATLTMDKHYISNEDAGSNFATMLLSSYEATGLGKADFVTNQDDGLNVISDNGTVWAVTENVAGSAQIKPDGTSSTAYAWPDSVKQYLPAVGLAQFDNTNMLQVSGVAATDIDFRKEWILILENVVVNSATTDDAIIFQWNDVLGRTIRVTYDQTNRRLRSQVYNGTSNLTISVGSLGTPVEYDTRYNIIISSRGNTLPLRDYKLEVVGFGTATNTLDYTAYTTANTSFLLIGGNGKKITGFMGNVSWIEVDGTTLFDRFPLENRIQASTDPNYGNIVGLDNGNVMVPSVDVSYMFPYLGPSQGLISDTPCVGDAFLTSGGAFLLSGGYPLVRGTWTPGYSKTSYTGGSDHIVYLGDSNAQTNAFPGEGITPYPDRHADYCATWLPDVTITNIALSGLSLYGMSQELYDRVKPYNTDPSLGLVGRYISHLTHNVEYAVSLGATIIVMSSGVATWTNSFTEGPYLAYEDMQIFEATKVYLDGLGIKLIAMTPVASKAVSTLLDATGLNTMAYQYKSELFKLGIDLLDENGTMRQGTDYIPDALMKDDTHKNDDGQIYLTENEIIPGFDRIFNMR